MSYATILQTLANALEAVETASVSTRPPYDAKFVQVENLPDTEHPASASAFRRFSIHGGKTNVASRLSTGREYDAECLLTVLYPSSRPQSVSETFMEDDRDVIREVFEDPSHWAAGVRLIAYRGSDAAKRDADVTKIVHRFSVVWVEE